MKFPIPFLGVTKSNVGQRRRTLAIIRSITKEITLVIEEIEFSTSRGIKGSLVNYEYAEITRSLYVVPPLSLNLIREIFC